MRGVREILLFSLLALALSGGVAAQPGKGQREARPTSNMSHEERRRLREDVDSARGNYDRRDTRRQDRMPPEERDKLRRDVQDANRDLRRK
jgi:hypothetical protein